MKNVSVFTNSKDSATIFWDLFYFGACVMISTIYIHTSVMGFFFNVEGCQGQSTSGKGEKEMEICSITPVHTLFDPD